MPDQNPVDPAATGPTSFSNIGTSTEPPPPPAMDSSDLPPAPPIVEPAPETPPVADVGGAAPTFDISSSISGTPPPKKKFGGRRFVATILGLLVLVGGLGAGIILVQQQQDIRERASIPSDGGGGGGGTPTLTPTATRVPTPRPTSTATPTPPPANACVSAGGQCYTAPNCTFAVGRPPVNGGSGCGNVNQVCCQKGGVITPTPTSSQLCPKSCIASPKSNCKPGSFYPNESQSLAYGDCGGIGSNEYCCDPVGGATPTPTSTSGVNICALSQRDPNSQGYCDRSAPNTPNCTDKAEGSSCTIVAQCGGGTGTCVVINQGGANSECQCQKGRVTTPVPTLTPPPGGGVVAQCLNIRAFDTNWTELTTAQLSQLKAGDKVRFAVGGTASGGSFDKAKFKINGVERAEVTGKKPDSQEFFDEYTLPAGVTTFTINAQIHHSSLGWSN